MIGSLPVSELAPLEYRYALDAAMPGLAANQLPFIICNSPFLKGELQQRLDGTTTSEITKAGLWLEPLVETWESELQTFKKTLPKDSTLIIVASRPLARILPEIKSRSEKALGIQPTGIYRLSKTLLSEGFEVKVTYGIHSITSIGINFVSQQAMRIHQYALSDRLLFKSKLLYCTTSPLSSISTVALIFAKKVGI